MRRAIACGALLVAAGAATGRAQSPAPVDPMKLAAAIEHATTARATPAGGPTVTLSVEKAQHYLLGIMGITVASDEAPGVLATLRQRPGETAAQWGARIGKDRAIVGALAAEELTPAEFVAIGMLLNPAWEAHHGRLPAARANPQALAWVGRNALALQALATNDGTHIPWPDGSSGPGR